MNSVDIEVLDRGTVIGFLGISAVGKEWLDTFVDDTMKQGGVYWADHGPARHIIDGIEDAGLSYQRG